jgi:flagellar hook-basal body complex protein FliE
MDGLTISSANKFIDSGGTKIGSGVGSSNSVSGNFKTEKNNGKTFADTLNEAISNVNELQLQSDQKVQELATGKTDDVAGVMITAEKADIALRAMVQVRNKIIDAYNEIMKMQV